MSLLKIYCNSRVTSQFNLSREHERVLLLFVLTGWRALGRISFASAWIFYFFEKKFLINLYSKRSANFYESELLLIGLAFYFYFPGR